ncbi:MAG: hypothetical protein ACKORL_00835 [Phycisphaerales bacterium]
MPEMKVLSKTLAPARRALGRTSRRDIDEAARILADEVDFMDHPDFHKAGAERRIFEQAPAVPKPTVTWYRPMMDEIGTTQPRRYD